MFRLFIIILFCGFFYCCSDNKKVKQKVVEDCLKNRNGLLGNKISQREPYSDDFFIDPIDDSSDYKYFRDGLYIRRDEKIFEKSLAGNNIECKTFYEFFKDVSDFIDTSTYRIIKNNYFTNKGKVYIRWANSDGNYPCEVEGADPETFQPFNEVAGGKDKLAVYYGGPPDNMRKIKGANPNTIKVLKKEEGCWNCNDCYFVDDKNVFFANEIIPNADVKSFQLTNGDTVDAKDKNYKYFNGKIIGKISE